MDQGESQVAGPGFVLIADDDPDFVSQLTGILADRGYLVLGAKDGQAAADLLKRHRQDISLAIIDVFMPLVGGMDLISELATDKANLKIIAISAGRQKVLDQAVSLGADAAVKKPPENVPLNAIKWLDAVFEQIGIGNSAGG